MTGSSSSLPVAPDGRPERVPTSGTGASPAAWIGCLNGAGAFRDAAPWPGFTLAAEAAVRHLRARFAFDLWMVSSAGTDGQTVVAAAGPWTALVRPGAQFRWTESLCRRFLNTGAGVVVPDVHAGDPSVAAGPLSRIRSYLGVPLVTGDSQLFGTLCAYHGETWSTPMDDVLETATVLGRMLSTIRAGEQAARDRSAEAAQAYAAADRDPLTGLLNRRGWQDALEVEEQRVRRYGGSASVLVLEVDGPAELDESPGRPVDDEALRACARVLVEAYRPGDAAARTGTDELALLAVHCDAVCVRALALRLRTALRSAGVTAAVGVATRRAGEDLRHAHARACQDLLRDKRRRAVRSSSGTTSGPPRRRTATSAPPAPGTARRS